MKKTITLLAAFLMLLQCTVFSYGSIENEHENNLLNVFAHTSIEKDSDFSQHITRRDAFLMALNVMYYGDCAQLIPEQEGFWLDDYADEANFSDVSLAQNKTDFRIAMAAYYFGLTKGKIAADGNLYVALDDNLTYEESRIICSRMIASWSGESYTLEYPTGNEDTSIKEFYELLYKTMFIPYTRNTYGGADTNCRYFLIVENNLENITAQ